MKVNPKMVLGAALLLLTPSCISTRANENLWLITSTSFGLEITAGQQSSSPGSVLLGYRRYEGLVAPVGWDKVPSVITRVGGTLGVTFTDMSGAQWFAIGDAATTLAGDILERETNGDITYEDSRGVK